MKLKTCDGRLLSLLALSLLAACLSLPWTRTVFLPADELGVVAADSSDYRRSMAWGAPFVMVIDRLDSEKLDIIDSKDDFSSAALLANWLFYFALSWPLSFFLRSFFRFSVRFAREVAHSTVDN